MKKSVVIFSVIILFVVGSWLFWPQLAERLGTPLSTLEQRGQFGDSFGSLNTLFTGLAFIGVAGSILLQISESRKRDEEAKRETIEARFFRLTDALRLIVAGMIVSERKINWYSHTLETTEKIKEGKDAFEFMVNALFKEISNLHQKRKLPSSSSDLALEAYATVYEKYQDDLGPYFRMLYRIFTYLERASEEDQVEYAKIVRAEFSASEVTILAANGASAYGVKLMPFIIRYNLLKHYPNETNIPFDLWEEKYK